MTTNLPASLSAFILITFCLSLCLYEYILACMPACVPLQLLGCPLFCYNRPGLSHITDPSVPSHIPLSTCPPPHSQVTLTSQGEKNTPRALPNPRLPYQLPPFWKLFGFAQQSEELHSRLYVSSTTKDACRITCNYLSECMLSHMAI